MCTPDAWGYTGVASSWVIAYGQADRHVRVQHADMAPAVVLAARAQRAAVLIDLGRRRARPTAVTTTAVPAALADVAVA
jgi:hypothetical protein